MQVGLISILPGQVYAFGVGVVAVSAFFWLLYKTRPGRAFRAIAEDPSGARLGGNSALLKTGLQSYALSGTVGWSHRSAARVAYRIASSALGEQVAIKVIAVSIIAGLGNLVGGLVVGLSLGIVEAIVQGYISGTWSNVIAFVIMLVVILAKPNGLFGLKI